MKDRHGGNDKKNEGGATQPAVSDPRNAGVRTHPTHRAHDPPLWPWLCPEEAQRQPWVTPHSHPCRRNLPPVPQ